MLALDPFRLDRSIAELARRYRRFVRALATSDAPDHAFELRPVELDEELWEQLARHPDPDPFLLAAREWLGRLFVEQGALEERRAWARALLRERHGLHAPEAGQFSVAEMLERALDEPQRRDAWMGAVASCAPAVAGRRFALWERRAELEERLGVSSISQGDAEIGTLAQSFLAATKDAYAELGIRSWQSFLGVGLGREVPGEWPNRVNTRSLAELVAEAGWFDGITPESIDSPRVLGASSILRGLWDLGRALHDAAVNPRLPFAVAREPRGARSKCFAALFSLLPGHASFATRRLGIGRARSGDYLRSLNAVLLIGARQAALRALLIAEGAVSTTAYRERFVELAEGALGFEVRPSLAGVVFADERALVDFSGLLAAARRDRELTETYDEDWFRNPRAARELRAELEMAPPRCIDLERSKAGLSDLVNALAR